jgi:hypothetical protein
VNITQNTTPDHTNMEIADLDTRAVAEAAISENQCARARQALHVSYQGILRGKTSLSLVRRQLEPLVQQMNRADFHCLIELAGTGLSYSSLPSFLNNWSRLARCKENLARKVKLMPVFCILTSLTINRFKGIVSRD